jgi:hypothetical protein
MDIHTAIAETITVNLDEADIFKAASSDEINTRAYEFAKVNNVKYPAVITKKFTKDKAYTDALRGAFPSHSSIVKLINIISEHGIAISSVKIRPTYFGIYFYHSETTTKTQGLIAKIVQEFSGIKVTPQTGWHDTNTNVGIIISPEMSRMRYNFDESVRLDEEDIFKPASREDVKQRRKISNNPDKYAWNVALRDIIQKFKGGSSEPLDGDEVDVLVELLRRKINYMEGNITADEYLGESAIIEDDVFKPATPEDVANRDATNPDPKWDYGRLFSTFPHQVDLLEARGLMPDIDPTGRILGFIDRGTDDILSYGDLPRAIEDITAEILEAAYTLENAVRKH